MRIQRSGFQQLSLTRCLRNKPLKLKQLNRRPRLRSLAARLWIRPPRATCRNLSEPKARRPHLLRPLRYPAKPNSEILPAPPNSSSATSIGRDVTTPMKLEVKQTGRLAFRSLVICSRQVKKYWSRFRKNRWEPKELESLPISRFLEGTWSICQL